MAEDTTSEEEFSVLIRDYSIPHMTELSPDSLLSKSQYAKVIFHDIADTYLTDADICCRYSLTDGVTPREGDKIAFYRVGWTSVKDYLLFEWAPPASSDKTELEVLFRASSLPKDVQEFYQLCYLTADDNVCGASVPFQFRHPYENELCAVEEPGGLLVVRSRTALTEEKLRQTLATNEQLQRDRTLLEKSVAELKQECGRLSAEFQSALQNLGRLETEKQVLEKRLEDNRHMERHVERLQKDLLELDLQKNQSLTKLSKAEQHISVLMATVDTLSADKEHMAQLLRSESQNKCGVVAEVSQYKGQVDSLSHMLEALTQSKELVAQELRVQQATNSQLRKDIEALEMQTREQQKKISEMENEMQTLKELLEQALNTEKSEKDKAKKISELEKEKEQLLSELVRCASKKEEDLKERTKAYEEKMRGVTSQIEVLEQQLNECKLKIEEKKKDAQETEQKNKCLLQQLKECQIIIANDGLMLTQIRQEKARLEREYNTTIKVHNEMLRQHARLAHEGPAPQERQLHFRDVFNELEHKIVSLEIEQEDTTNHKRIQLERIKSIAERFEELNVEAGRLECEKNDVVSIRGTQEEELAQTVEKLTNLRGWTLDSADPEVLKYTVNELTLFVESSNMRIMEIDQRLREIEEEKTVLTQQQNLALERKNSCEKHETEVRREIADLQEQERTIVREQGGQLANLQDRLDQALLQNSEMMATGLSQEEELALARKEKVELEQQLQENRGGSSTGQEQDCSSLNSADVNSCLEQEQDLKLRLQMAAAEYRKLYTEKQKVEKKLAKLCQKLGERKSKASSAGEEPATAELISLSQPPGGDSRNDLALATGTSHNNTTCPICSEKFPPGASDLFRQHFESHLS